jgi:hypothetical protein
MEREEFLRVYSTWDLNQRISFERFVRGGAVDSAAEDRVILDWARTNMGPLGVYLNHPEIGPILLQAAREGWNDQRLNLAVTSTTFFKTTTANQREWGLLQTTDPATASKQISNGETAIRTFLSQQGASLSDEQITTLASSLRSNGGEGAFQNQQGLAEATLALIQYNPTDVLYGSLKKSVTNVKQVADEYLVTIDDKSAFEYAKAIQMGKMTADNVTEAMKSQAKASYSQFSDQLDKGITMKAISDPYRQQAAQLLEVSPETISMNDNKYSQMLSYSDGKSPTPRAMSLGEAAKHIKSQEEYHFTKQANQEAASLASTIANKFGAL